MVYEKEVLVLPRLAQPGSIVLDIGANLGVYTVVLARLVGSEGRVHSFEPGRRAFAQLQRMVSLTGVKNVRLHHAAVGDSEGSVRLSIPRHDLRFAHIARAPATSETPTEVVRCTTLDAFACDGATGPISLVKCDCEGGEYAVFAGGSAVLDQKPTLIVEVAEPHCRRFDYSAEDLFGLLRGHGYEAFSFDVERDCLVAAPRPTFDPTGHTWTAQDGYLGNNNYVFIHSQRRREHGGLLGAE